MQDLFTTLTRAVEGNAVLALSAAVTWGILSIVMWAVTEITLSPPSSFWWACICWR